MGPCFKVDINKIEDVQRRFTKACLPKMSYEERLFRLGLQTLELHRIMTDLITCYKLINGEPDIDCDSFISSFLFFFLGSVRQIKLAIRQLLDAHIKRLFVQYSALTSAAHL